MDKRVKTILIVRSVLWVTAAAATIHWIYWSFKLYDMEIFDVHEYAFYFRPIFGRDLLITGCAVAVSFILRSVSDKIKQKIKEERDKADNITRI